MNTAENFFDNITISSVIKGFDFSIVPVVITNCDWENGIKILYANQALCNATGYKQEEIIGQNPKIFQGKDSNYEILNELKDELLQGNDFIGQTINYKKDGTPYHVRWTISHLYDQNNQLIGYISLQKIITKTDYLNVDKLLSAIVNISNNLILATNLEGYIIYANDAFKKKLGYTQDELIGEHSRKLKSGIQDKEFYKRMWKQLLHQGSFNDVFISKKKDGTLFYDKKEIRTIYNDNGDPLYYVSISQDITDDMEKRKLLESEVFNDTLTGLHNRKKYDLVIEDKIKEFELHQKIFSLMLIDIDHFKKVNDTYGHEVGDKLLKQFSALLKSKLRTDDLLFRWGGEEFALLIDNNQEDTYKLALKLKNAIQKTDFEGLHITASFGISQISDTNIQTLFNNADKALYSAKNSGRNIVCIYQR